MAAILTRQSQSALLQLTPEMARRRAVRLQSPSMRQFNRSSLQEMTALVSNYAWPSEAFWRFHELQAWKRFGSPSPPLLEIGCGDGRFTAMIFPHVDDAIDINPRAVARARHVSVYGQVRVLDARQLAGTPNTYGTVFASSVLEHIPEVAKVLRAVCRTLRRDGQFLASVPLLEMNQHLLLRSPRYARWRQRQLAHVNLWTEAQWREQLLGAGFSGVEFVNAMQSASCKFWDRLDLPGTLGSGRYRVASAVRFLTGRMPSRAAAKIDRRIATSLLSNVVHDDGSKACVCLFIASKEKLQSSRA